MSVTLSASTLSGFLSEAKDAHTRYEERFRIEGVQPPEHRWEDWCGRYIMARLWAEEANTAYGELNCRLENGDKAISEAIAIRNEADKLDKLSMTDNLG